MEKTTLHSNVGTSTHTSSMTADVSVTCKHIRHSNVTVFSSVHPNLQLSKASHCVRSRMKCLCKELSCLSLSQICLGHHASCLSLFTKNTRHLLTCSYTRKNKPVLKIMKNIGLQKMNFTLHTNIKQHLKTTAF